MKQLRTELKYALAFFTMTLLWMCMERLVGLHSTHIDQHYIYTNFIAIPAILVYVIALREKRNRDYQGIISYRQAFASGLIMTLFITILAPLAQYITSVYITPHFFENIINYSVTNKKQTMEEAVAYFNLNNYLKETLIGTPFMGIFTTAIVSIFIRKSK